jgi:hypothetical protein
MTNNRLAGLFAIGLMVVAGLPLGVPATNADENLAPAFREDDWRAQFVSAWEEKSATKMSDLYSSIYYDAGESKEDAIAHAKAVFDGYESISCRFRILKARRFEDNPKLVSVKHVLEIKGRKPAAQDYEPAIQTMGYQSLVFENGKWRIYAAQFFCDPRMPKFDFGKDRGNWPAPSQQVRMATYEPASEGSDEARWHATASASESVPFDVARWEKRIEDGWNKKDASLILSCFSKLYNEVGYSREEANRPVAGFFERYDTLKCRYRVLGVRHAPGSKLANVKAVMEMSGVPAGQKQSTTFIQTMGYASLILEDGDWRMYASQLWYWPKVPHFDFEREQGNWPPWGTVVDMRE